MPSIIPSFHCRVVVGAIMFLLNVVPFRLGSANEDLASDMDLDHSIWSGLGFLLSDAWFENALRCTH
jgi:hypothetical protein